MPISQLLYINSNHSNQSGTETKHGFVSQEFCKAWLVLVNGIIVMKELGNNIRMFHQTDTSISMIIGVFHFMWFSRRFRTCISCSNKKLVLVEYP
jgi:hypothetical protein